MDFKSLWVEKYRPKTLDDIILSDENRKILESYSENKMIPHLFFVSTPGKGKTSLAKIIVNDILKCDYLYINASDENGIDTIRYKIIGFAQTKSLDGGIKVIILDESDFMSPEAMRSLRNTIEEYSDNTRFILTANYKHKVIPAIQSRCQTLEFEYSISDVAKHVLGILNKENIAVSNEQILKLKTLIKTDFPDIRKIINTVQKYSLSGTLDIKENTLSDTFVEEIFLKLKIDEVFEVREYVIKNESTFQSDYHNLLKGLLNLIYEKNIDPLKKKECILIIAEHMYRHTFVMDIEINAFSCFIGLSKLLFGT